MGETKVLTDNRRPQQKTRMLLIVVDGVRREELAGPRTALEVQHELRHTGKTVRVTEHYR